MGSYKIEWKQSAWRELRNLDRAVIPRILAAVEALADDPHPKGSKKLVGSEHTYRIRIGDYRVVYSLRATLLIIEIMRVGHRKEVYR
jgi:mRNA interferase RelE/StbE